MNGNNMTIKQVADSLNVSKTAVRNYMDEDFREKYTTKDDKGVITITPEGCKLLSENIGKQAENTEKQFSETELVTIPRSVLTMMERQIEQLQEELSKERQHSRELTDKIAQIADQAQHLQAGTMQPLLSDASEKPSTRKKWSLNPFNFKK